MSEKWKDRDTWLERWIIYRMNSDLSVPPEIKLGRDTLPECAGIVLADRTDRQMLLRYLDMEFLCRFEERLGEPFPLSLELEMRNILYANGWRAVCAWLRSDFPRYAPLTERIAGELETELRQSRVRVMQTVTEKELQMPIEELSLMIRTYNCLKRAGIHTVEDVMEHSREEILHIRNFHWKCLRDLEFKLAEVILRDLEEEQQTAK